VVLTEDSYQELLEAQQETALARIKASLEDAAAGSITRHDSVEALMRHLETPAA
jgi:predicted transcriptional regulator